MLSIAGVTNWESVPDRGPGHAFIAIAHAGWHRHTNVWKTRVVAWHSELARRILLRPTPTPAGDKPLASRSLRPHYTSQSPPLWIPAFAGMTNGGPEWRMGTRKDEQMSRGMRVCSRPGNIIFVPIAHAGWRRHTKV